MASKTAAATVTYASLYKPYISITHATGFTADADVTTGIDLWAAGLGDIRKFVLTVSRTAGATDAVSVKIQVSWDNTNWLDLPMSAAVTSVAGANPTTSPASYAPAVDWTSAADYISHMGFRYVRTYCTTVGAGNTLIGTLQCWAHHFLP